MTTTNLPQEKYEQDWKAYNKAKTLEPILFKVLLYELLDIYYKESIKKGKRVLPKDRIFMMCMKIYNNSALRKAQGQIKDANLGEISFKSICNFFNDESLTSEIDDLILITSLPMASLETTGAIDSTGFTGSRLENWNRYKFSMAHNSHLPWYKAHVVCGCKTNIIISNEVTDKNVADISMLEKVVGDKIKYFELKDFVGDKAYSSRKVMNFLEKMGLTPLIPFKKNTTQNPDGSMMWKKMYKYFHEHQEEFYQRYHKRSNIETTFAMIKHKFGQSIFNKKKTACINEIKIKFLCHNICVLIQEMFENDILPDFEACVNRIEPV